MNTTRLPLLAVALPIALAACGDDGGGTGGGSGGSGSQASGTQASGTDATSAASGTTSSGGDGGGDAGSTASGTSAVASGGVGGGTGSWQPLITAAWTLEPGGEKTSDISATIAERDMYIGGIRPIAPFGTHHTVLALDAFETANYIYASGVETNEILFPPGVGLKIAAGQPIILQLHIFNPSAETLNELSGIEVIELAPEDVEQEADIILPGPVGLDIPPHQETTISAACTLQAETNLFALFPHMHQLGAHFQTTLVIDGEEQVLHDEPYDFEHQPFIPFEPITLQPGDQIETTCTWNNTTGNQVGWGESSTAEMCFSILYRWPAQSDASFCTN